MLAIGLDLQTGDEEISGVTLDRFTCPYKNQKSKKQISGGFESESEFAYIELFHPLLVLFYSLSPAFLVALLRFHHFSFSEFCSLSLFDFLFSYAGVGLWLWVDFHGLGCCGFYFGGCGLALRLEFLALVSFFFF